ncbi:hypothetical protein CKM354_001031200 [Cercospora kikuchii]|uniref:Uncharacterized protein n=1 Tax=Cercospora kikuchii TaxID=84275 RepID=A0A9P3CQS8_9PEZI|nr:uncharacterized protein CKM354_001031200 [Cercospora kikuchii]GIZ47213.1 hypothetical protein CKM354_001031200 [Cercospora kikuchii]
MPPVSQSGVVLFSIDLGSCDLKCWVKYVPPGHKAENTPACCVELLPYRREIRLSLLLVDDEDGNRKLLWDDEVTMHLSKHPEDRHRVFANLKLTLSPEHRSHPAVKHIRKVLGIPAGESGLGEIEYLHVLIFEKVRESWYEWCSNTSRNGMGESPEYWRTVMKEAKVTIPAMWDTEAQSVMRNAAVRAGFENVRLYLEPLCAAGGEVFRLFLDGKVKDGEHVVMMDIGNLTDDMAITRVDAPSEPGGRPHVVQVGEAAGASTGCFLIYEFAWEWFVNSDQVREQGGIEEILRRLNKLPEAEMRRQFSECVEAQIRRRTRHCSFLIAALSKPRPGDGTVAEKTFIFPDNILERCIREWAARIVTRLDEFLDTEQCRHIGITCVYLTGGGSLNSVLLETLKQHLQSRDMEVRRPDSQDAAHAVARGGSEQYPTNEADQIREGYYYIIRDEPFVATRHSDVKVKWKFDPVAKVRKVDSTTTPDLIYKSAEDGWFVRDRLQLAYHHSSQPTEYPRVLTVFPVDKNSKAQLRFTVYFSERPHQTGNALRMKDGRLKKGFEKFLVQRVDVDVDWAQYRFNGYSDAGTKWDLLDCFVSMSGSAQNLRLCVQVLEPQQAFEFDWKSKYWVPDPDINYKVITTIRPEIWAPYRSHVISPESRAPALSAKRTSETSKTIDGSGTKRKRRKSPKIGPGSIVTRSRSGRNSSDVARGSLDILPQDKGKQRAQHESAMPRAIDESEAGASDSILILPCPDDYDGEPSVGNRSSFVDLPSVGQAQDESDDEYVPEDIPPIIEDGATFIDGKRNSLWPLPVSSSTPTTSTSLHNNGLLDGARCRYSMPSSFSAITSEHASSALQPAKKFNLRSTPKSALVSEEDRLCTRNLVTTLWKTVCE